MRRLLFSVLSLALMVGVAPSVLAAAPQGLQGTMTIDPTSGPVGTVITVAGDNCSTKADVFVDVFATNTVEEMKTIEPDASGDWTTTFTVADDAPVGATVVVEATCRYNLFIEDAAFQGVRAGGPINTLFVYAPQTFTVTASPTTSEDTTTTTEGTTTTTEAGEVEDADAAAPVVAQPTFTG